MADTNTKPLNECSLIDLIQILASQRVALQPDDANSHPTLAILQRGEKVQGAMNSIVNEFDIAGSLGDADKEATLKALLVEQVKETQIACVDQCGPETAGNILEEAGVKPETVAIPTPPAAPSAPKAAAAPQAPAYDYDKAIDGKVKGNLNVAKMQEIINDCGYKAGKVDGYTGKNTRRGAAAFAEDLTNFGIESDELSTALENIKTGQVTEADVAAFEAASIECDQAKKAAQAKEANNPIASLKDDVLGCAKERKGADVKTLQTYLDNQGYKDVGGADGSFGPKTARATAQLQATLGVTVDGTFGPETYNAITEAVNNGTDLSFDANKDTINANSSAIDAAEKDARDCVAARKQAASEAREQTRSNNRSHGRSTNRSHSSNSYPTKVKCSDETITLSQTPGRRDNRFGYATIASGGTTKNVWFKTEDEAADFMQRKEDQSACRGGQKAQTNQFEREDGRQSQTEINLATAAVRKTLKAHGIRKDPVYKSSGDGRVDADHLCNLGDQTIQRVYAKVDGMYPGLGAKVEYCPDSNNPESARSTPSTPSTPTPQSTGKEGQGQGQEGGTATR